MRDSVLSAYHRLPSAMRSGVASLRGFYLGSWRYGSNAGELLAEAQERERWSAERWRSWRQERLGFILERAATRVPFYRRQWEERRLRGDKSPWDRLENWPILAKDSVREDPGSFVAEDCDVRRMYHEHTSGTTGKPLHLWQSRTRSAGGSRCSTRGCAGGTE